MDEVLDYAAVCAGLETLYRTGGILPRAIGRTALGRAVFALDFGKRTPRALLLGGICGDGATSRLLLSFLEVLLSHRREGVPFFGVDPACVLNNCGVTVIPCLNPDGLEVAAHGPDAAGVLRRFVRPLLRADTQWQANAQGVDLRHQFSAGFERWRESGEQSPAAAGFGGEQPQSEAESRALAVLCRKQRFRHALLLQPGEAGLWFHPPQNAPAVPLAAKLLAQELFVSPQRASEADGGFPFWFSETFRRPAYTIQTGKGTSPLPEKMLSSCLLLTLLL